MSAPISSLDQDSLQKKNMALIQNLFENQWELLHQLWCTLDQFFGSQSTTVKMKIIQTLTYNSIIDSLTGFTVHSKNVHNGFYFFIWIIQYLDILNFLPEKQSSND